MTTAKELLAKLGETHRVEYVPVDKPNVIAEGVNIWLVPADRYAWTTVWAPIPDNEASAEWLWGPSYNYDVPGDVGLDELVKQVLATLPEKGCPICKEPVRYSRTRTGGHWVHTATGNFSSSEGGEHDVNTYAPDRLITIERT
jgi:hypothetical protein